MLMLKLCLSKVGVQLYHSLITMPLLCVLCAKQ